MKFSILSRQCSQFWSLVTNAPISSNLRGFIYNVWDVFSVLYKYQVIGRRLWIFFDANGRYLHCVQFLLGGTLSLILFEDVQKYSRNELLDKKKKWRFQRITTRKKALSLFLCILFLFQRAQEMALEALPYLFFFSRKSLFKKGLHDYGTDLLIVAWKLKY